MPTPIKFYKVTELPVEWEPDSVYFLQDLEGATAAIYITSQAGVPYQGTQGQSAYELAVELGFVGTEGEWIASLVGADGADGAQGLPGEPGIQGVAGNDGADGAQGIQGEQGVAGADGAGGGTSSFTLFALNVSSLTIPTSSTNFVGFFSTSSGGFHFSSSENLRQIMLPEGYTLSRFRARITTAQPATGQATLTIRKNGVNTALVITIPADSPAGMYSNTVDTVDFLANDLLSVQCNSVDGVGAVLMQMSVLCTPSP